MQLEAELANRERMLDLKDQELAALQQQLARLRDQAETGMEAPVEAPIDDTPLALEPRETEAPEMPEAVADAPDAAPETPAPDAAPETPAGTPALPPAVSTTTAAAESESFFSQLLGNVLFWAGLAVALLAGLFLARRRRSSDDATGRWEQLADEEEIDEESREATDRLRAPVTGPEETFVVEEGTASGTDALEDLGPGTAEIDRSGDQELPLERTLSSDAGLNLDQSDPISEAEFHMAYGLYDQAADLLVAAQQAEPERRDLRRKLLDVYFVWENKGGFLKEAQAFHEKFGAEDSDWNKVLIMGKQLCPDEALFEGQAAPSGGDDAMDLELFEGGGGDVDLPLGDAGETDLPLSEEDGKLDLDLSAVRGESEDDLLDFDLAGAEDDDDLSPTLRDSDSDSPTQETPTIEQEGLASPTVESPTIDQPMNEPTMESPTIETAMGESTMETPTIESPMVDLPLGEEDDRTSMTSETASLDLDELGLDLSEFDDVEEPADEGEATLSDDNATLGDDDATLLAGDLDDATLLRKAGGGLDSTAEVEALGGGVPAADDDLGGLLNTESTAEVQTVDADEADAELGDLEELLGSGSGEIGDTQEQPKPAVEDTAEQPAPEAGIDLDIGEEAADENTPTGTLDMPERRPEGPTMTEVGTKLDLARAYIDMGDPDGARSILGEVVEEGDDGQRQEAQKLIDELSD
jgi:pilus assembly protein FimV